MNAYVEASKVEKQGVPDIVEWLTHSGFSVTLFSGKHSSIKALQKVGDAVLTKGDEQYVVDFKVEKKTTGNLFIEWWSNRHPVRPTPGWGAKTESRFILYYFIDTRTLYCIDPMKLSRFLTVGERWRQYKEIEQREYEQLNMTTGLIVPISDLRSAGVFASEPRVLNPGVAV